MTKFTPFRSASAGILFLLLSVGCNQSGTDEATNKTEALTATTVKADPVSIKAEIQELEVAWGKADNARDVNAMLAFYADDAVSMGDDKPSLVGKEAIKKDIEEYMSKRAEGSTVTYNVLDVFPGDNYVTEVGTGTRKDAAGKVTSTSKYMAVWEKRNGKWICIRDIGNDDAEKK
jgi:uncharacterized protein (TIGR02246 family)